MSHKSKLKKKLIIVFALLIVVTIAVEGLFSFYSLNKACNSAIQTEKDKFDMVIKTSVETVIGALDTNHQRYLNGEITNEEEMKIAEGIVRDSRYNNGDGYFWADLENGMCAVHTNPDYQGKMRIDEKDLEGNYFIRNLITAGNQTGGGYTEFYFTRLGEEGSFKKRGFTEKYEPYGWYISTGNYFDDIQPAIDAYQKSKTDAIIGLGVCSLVLLVVAVLTGASVSTKITKYVDLITKRLGALAKGDIHSPVPEINTNDELSTLAEVTQVTVSNLSTIIRDIGIVLGAIATGNLCTEAAAQYPGDLNVIHNSMQQIQKSLSSTMLRIDTSADEVTNGAEQVASGAQALSQGATEQAAAVQELSATINDISVQIKENSENAKNAGVLSEGAGNGVNESNEYMAQMMAAMNEISETSGEIGKIIKTIDDIAFQTNILALNAAVEAARAGAAGKGFAVVADEVRNLAAKSAEAAQSTTALIESAIVAVEKGTKIADATSKSLQTVVEKAGTVVVTIQQIATASESQAAAVEQVTQGIEQISAVVQTNSATAEESAAASEELSSQAQILKGMLSNFQLDNDSATFGSVSALPVAPEAPDVRETVSPMSKY